MSTARGMAARWYCSDRVFACLAPAAVVTTLFTAAAGAEDIILPVQQGTDISVTADRDGHLVTYLAGQLWRLPATGGEAVAFTPPRQFVSRPAFSPDGRTLAYQSLRDGVFQIVLADADGTNPRQVTDGPWNHLAPAWAPDGRRLAISSDRGGDFSIWELDVDSRALLQLTFEPGQELDPAWEPTGKSLAYISQRAEGSALMLRSLPLATRTLATNPSRLRAPSWRPDGTVISVVADTAQGPRLHAVILSEPPVVKVLSPTEVAIAAPAVWPDRNRLLYTADGRIRMREFGAATASEIPFQAQLGITAIGDASGRSLPTLAGAQPAHGLAGIAVLPNGHVIISALGDLWEIDGGGQLVRALTQDAFVDRDPAVSADGRRLAFTSDRDGSPQIWVMDLALGETRQLTAESGFAGHPAWNSRADQLAYLAGDEPGGEALSLKLLALQTGALMELASNLIQPGTPAWSPGDTQVGIVQRDDGVARLLLFATDGGGARRRLTLPAGVTGAGATQLQWSDDGKSLLVASSAGLRLLPTQADGLVGAEWHSVADVPAQAARRVPGRDAVLFTDAVGLASIAEGVAPTRIPVALSWQPAPAPGRTVIRASRVFDGTSETYLYNHEVVIDNGRIVAVQPWTDSPPGGGDTLVDARGKTVLPGLIDLAVQPDETSGERLGRTLLAYGITTVQAFGSGDGELREISERWQARRSGPRLLLARDLCGTVGSWKTGESAGTGGALRLCPTATGQLALLAETAQTHGDAVWSEAWLAAGSGLINAIGLPGTRPLQPAQDAIAGRGVLYQDAIDVLVRSGVVVIPTLAPRALPLLVSEQPDLTASPQYLQLQRQQEIKNQAQAWQVTAAREGSALRGWLRDRQRMVGRIAAGGGHLATASAAPATPYGLGLHAEIRLLAGAGLKPAQVLRMATAEPARALGLQQEIGTLAAGRRADVLIVAGDPLRQVSDLLHVDAVVTDGYLHSGPALISAPPAALEKFTPPADLNSSKRTKVTR